MLAASNLIARMDPCQPKKHRALSTLDILSKEVIGNHLHTLKITYKFRLISDVSSTPLNYKGLSGLMLSIYHNS